MSFSTAVFASNISQMMVELVNQHIRVVEILLARYVDRLLTMNIAPQRPLLSPRKSYSESGQLNTIMLREELERILGALLDRD